MAGGVPAGRLEIEIVAAVARLQDDMRKIERTVGQSTGRIARDAKAANDNLRSIGQNAGQGVQQFSREVAQLKANLDPAWAAAQRFRQQQELVNQAFREGAITAKQQVEQLRANAAAFQGAGQVVNKSADAQRAGMQQLGFQLQDFAVQTAGGTSAVRAFAQQFPQALGALQMMTSSTSKLGAFLGGPWGIAVGVAAAALLPLIEQLWNTKDAADGARDALAALRKERMQEAQEKVLLNTASAEYNRLAAEEARLQDVIAKKSRGRTQPNGTPMFAYKEFQQLQKVRSDMAEASEDVNFQVTKITGSLDGWLKKDEEVNKSTERSTRVRKAAISDLQKAINQQNEETQQFIASLQDEIAKIGLDEKALRQLEIAKQMEAAQTEKQRQKIAELNVEREKALALLEAEKAAKANLEIVSDIKKAERELALIGMTGIAREKAVIALSEQAEIEAVLVQIQKAEADGNTELIAQLQKRIDLIRQKYDVERKGVDLGKQAEDDAAKLKLVNDQLRDMIGLLGNLGKVGSIIGGLLGIFTGNTSAVGGPLGELLNIDITRKDKKTGEIISTTIGDELSRVFGPGSKYEQVTAALSEALKGAGTGMLAADFLGMKSTTEKIGSALGGAAGKAIGTALGGPLGGAVGSVLGGIAGGFVGGLFKKTKSGGATLTGANQFSTFGNSSSRKDAAGDLAGSVMDGLNNIAKALGGSFSGGFNTTIGIRGKDYRVNPNGTSLKTSKGAIDFGQDAQAAIAYAIQDAIKDGALMGLRAGTQALLQKEGDFEAQLQKALAFEGVFRDLKAMTNPLVGGLEDLAAKFKELQAIFTEAGASAEEFAQLQEYMTKQQQALIDSISSTYKSLFLTDKEALAAAKKTIKDTLAPLGKGSVDTVAEYKALVKATDALKDPELYGTLMELADEFGVIQDAAEAAKEAAAAQKALAEALKAQKGALQVELLKAQGKTLEATAKQREMELAAMDASLRPLQKQVWAHQDLAEVYERESANLQGTIDTFAKLGDSLREFRRGLYQTDDATNAYAVRLAELQRVGNLAGLGDRDAMGLLPGVGQDFLDVARKQAGSLQDYQRDVARVARYADSAIGSADGMVSEAQAQLDVLEEQVSQFIQLNDTALSIEAALQAMVVPVSEAPQANQDIATRLDRNNELMERFFIAMESGALASIDTARILRRVTRDGTSLATTEAA